MKRNTTDTTGKRIVVREGEVHQFNDDGSVTIREKNSLLPLGQDAGSKALGVIAESAVLHDP